MNYTKVQIIFQLKYYCYSKDKIITWPTTKFVRLVAAEEDMFDRSFVKFPVILKVKLYTAMPAEVVTAWVVVEVLAAAVTFVHFREELKQNEI